MSKKHPIFQAIHENDLVKIKEIIENDPECLTKRNRSRHTPLIVSAMSEKKHAVTRLLLSYPGNDLDAQDKSGYTALHQTCFNGDIEEAQRLIERGANINIKDHYLRTPLIVAAYLGQRRMVETLLLSSAEVDHMDDTGRSLFYYIKHGFCDIPVDFILKHGTIIEEKTKKSFIGLRLEKLFV